MIRYIKYFLVYCRDMYVLYNEFRKLSFRELSEVFYIMETNKEKRAKCYDVVITLIIISSILGIIIYPTLVLLFWNLIIVSLFNAPYINYFIALISSIFINHILSFIERKLKKE